MSNNFTVNPIYIDTAFTGATLANQQTIVSLAWTGNAGSRIETGTSLAVTNSAGVGIFKIMASSAVSGTPVIMNYGDRGVTVDGIEVPTLDAGTLSIQLG